MAERFVGHLSDASGDVHVTGRSQDVDREAAERCHVLRPVSGADLRGVFGENGVADEVEPVLDHPLGTGELSEPLGGCLAGCQVGERVNSLPADLAGPDVGAVAQDFHGLDRVGKVQAEVGDRQGPGRPRLLAAVPRLAVVARRFSLSIRQVELLEANMPGPLNSVTVSRISWTRVQAFSGSGSLRTGDDGMAPSVV